MRPVYNEFATAEEKRQIEREGLRFHHLRLQYHRKCRGLSLLGASLKFGRGMTTEEWYLWEQPGHVLPEWGDVARFAKVVTTRVPELYGMPPTWMYLECGVVGTMIEAEKVAKRMNQFERERVRRDVKATKINPTKI